MKKNFKLFLLAGLALVGLTGCTNKTMKAAYDKMQVSDSMNGYTIDCRLYGNYNDKSINDIVRIENYMNKQYSISITDSKKMEEIFNKKKEEVLDENKEDSMDDYIANDDLIYSDGVMYEDSKTGYVKSEKTTNYKTTDVYLTGLIKTSKVTKVENDKIGDTEYEVYELKVSKSSINEIAKNTSLTDYKADKDINAKVWIDKDGFVYKVKYNLVEESDNNKSGLTLDILFFGYNTSREYSIPTNM